MILQRTPLFAEHLKLGAKMVDFGGWEMPVQYTSITDEHLAVRKAAGIFDISHMGEVTLSGAAAGDFLNHLLTNDIRKLTPGNGQYTLMCNERGGVVDDLYAYRLSKEVYLLIINASRTDADVAWLQAQAVRFHTGSELKLTDASHHYGAVAVQGPRVAEFIGDCIPGGSTSCKRAGLVTELKKNQIGGFAWKGGSVLVSRTGYTGEDGFEILGREEDITDIGTPVLGRRRTVWHQALRPRRTGHVADGSLLSALRPRIERGNHPDRGGTGGLCGVGQGGIHRAIRLAAQKADGVSRKCVAFKMTGRSAPPRPQYPIWSSGNEGRPIGQVTSGTQSPSLGIGIGMGYVPPEFAQPGTTMEIEIRGQRNPAMVVAKPIYRKT